MVKYTFKGGIHVNEHKNTAGCHSEMIPSPQSVCIPLSQHIGAPAVPLVKLGDKVEIGQKIADVPADKLGCPIHASISGTVKQIIKKTIPSGALVEHIIIENDFENKVSDTIVPFGKAIEELTTDDVIGFVREAGISGMGGAAFPTYAKIKSAVGKVDTIIINCAECEPFITANHRLLLEMPELVIEGIRILVQALGVKNAIIAIEDNKPDAIKLMRDKLVDDTTISVKVLKTKYPQGDERQLIFALLGREIPTGKLPADVGCVIFNAETCATIDRAYAQGRPSIIRFITVDGDCIKTPKNLRVPIGTPCSELIRICGGLVKEPYKLINGGPMMGIAQWDIEMPVTKSTSALLLFSEEFGKKKATFEKCIHCGKCIKNCPMHIMPMYIAQYTKIGDIESAEKYGAMSCVESGSWSYNCPGGVEIVQYIRAAKATIRAEYARLNALKKN